MSAPFSDFTAGQVIYVPEPFPEWARMADGSAMKLMRTPLTRYRVVRVTDAGLLVEEMLEPERVP